MPEALEQPLVGDAPGAPEVDATTTPVDAATGNQPQHAEDEQQHEQHDGEDGEASRRQRGGVQRRFGELTRARDVALARAEALERANQQLLSLVEGRSGQQAQAQQQQGPQPPRSTDFDTWDDYTAALARHNAEETARKVVAQTLEQHQRQAQERAQAEAAARAAQQVQAAFVRRRDEFAKATPDFEDVMANADNVQVSNHLMTAIMSSEAGPQLMYHLAKTPEVAARLSGLPPALMLKEVGKLEGALTSATPAVSRAPAPGKPVGARSAPQDPLSEKLDTSAWIRNFQRQRYSR